MDKVDMLAKVLKSRGYRYYFKEAYLVEVLFQREIIFHLQNDSKVLFRLKKSKKLEKVENKFVDGSEMLCWRGQEVGYYIFVVVRKDVTFRTRRQIVKDRL